MTHSGGGRYAIASIDRNVYTSYLERNFAANSAVDTRYLSPVLICIPIVINK